MLAPVIGPLHSSRLLRSVAVSRGGDGVRRRDFLGALGGSGGRVAAHYACAQGERGPRFDVLCSRPAPTRTFGPPRGVPQGMQQLGWSIGCTCARHPRGLDQCSETRRHAEELAALSPAVSSVPWRGAVGAVAGIDPHRAGRSSSNGLAQSSSLPIRSFSAGANNLSRWLRVTRFQPFTNGATSPRLAV